MQTLGQADLEEWPCLGSIPLKVGEKNFSCENIEWLCVTDSTTGAPVHTGRFYYEINSGPQKNEKKMTISNLKMPFTKVLD